MSKQWLSNFILAGTIRLLLMNSGYQKVISDRVEVSTALNSWKRVTEGVHLYNFGIDPYTGDLFHETPIGLYIFNLLQQYLSCWTLFFLFTATDLLTALLLAFTAKQYATELAFKKEEKSHDENVESENVESENDSAISTSMIIDFNDKMFYILELFINFIIDIARTLSYFTYVPDLRPNIGLYWYFFTELFEHFRWLFIASFQINVSLLYIVPLALRLRHDPMLLAFSYLAIAAIFKSYPCIGDVGFYMSLLPLWKHLFQYTHQRFIVGCFMLFCTVFAPTVWYQWIYSRSANANFYFGVTLAFAIAQIFLLTDILFASVKHEFAIRHGINKDVSGSKAKLLLE
ncbi:phosphatidylinositol glycan anchor biosynthesis class U isoform X2 [Ptiloglossa arizonensis]|uniref:phosphatidylinositol glycan anchor biosynthesis class U isoform X2 n=1 Tax=Ptiloglossa arizonensis TaxID=3350558 RepID=UPI003FA1406E